MSLEQLFVLCLLFLVLLCFVKEFYPPEVIALGATAALVATSILDVKTFLSVFSSSAPITIVMMFIMSAALERTGVLSILGEALKRYAKGSFLRVMLLMMLGTIFVSAFMNNTPVVVMMTPIMISVAASVNVSPSRLLIPLSFAAIFGGTLTLVGTSTNILVSSLAEQMGQPAISMFEMTLPGLVFAGVGMIYMIFAGRYLLPDRTSLAGLLKQGEKRKFMARVLVASKSRYIGKKLADLPFNKPHSRILDVIRGEVSLRKNLDEIRLQPGDRIVLKTDTAEILGLKEDGGVEFRNFSDQGIEPVTAEQTVTMEASIGPKSHLRGKTLDTINLRRNYGIYVMAVHRNDKNISDQVDNIHLQFADTLLLDGPLDGIQRLVKDEGVINLSMPAERPIRRSKAPIAILTMMFVMILAAFDVLPIAGLALIGAVIVMVTRCIDPEEAFEVVDWRILFLIFGMLGLSLGLEKTGAARLIVDIAIGALGDVSPLAVLAVVYILTSLFTEMISNNAVAVLIGPIAISLALQLGYDPRPFIFAVMFAASASFATPIGYQTNTFVYSAGGYKFADFIKVGLPLNIIFAIVALTIIPLFYPF